MNLKVFRVRINEPVRFLFLHNIMYILVFKHALNYVCTCIVLKNELTF